jgi:D-serine deaminase-like pyridoxal phosphate-dependent protein
MVGGGTRTLAQATAVATAVGSARLCLVGVAGFEGSVGMRGGAQETLEAVRRYVRSLRQTGEQLRVDGLVRGTLAGEEQDGRLVLSAGGSCFFDVVTGELAKNASDPATVRVVLRSGGYVCHDHGLLARWSPFVRGNRDGHSAPSARGLEPGHQLP